MTIYNIYCDESCHLENDGINSMVIGAIWCPQEKIKEFNTSIKQIKKQHYLPASLELKWTKISPAKINLYKDIINYFFDDDNLHFRAVIIQDKSKLDHDRFNQTHDTWYYKMYFEMLKAILSPRDKYNIFLDIKDTNSYDKSQKLREVCSNSMYDFSKSIITKLQPVRSNEIELMQIVDILIGALAYYNRNFPSDFEKSSAKLEIINLIKNRSKYNLNLTTLLKEEKFNLLVWDAR